MHTPARSPSIALYRALLHTCRRLEAEAPPRFLSLVERDICGNALHCLSARNPSLHASSLVRAAFRQPLPGSVERSMALSDGFRSLRVLNAVQHSLECSRQARSKLKYGVGMVMRHRQYGYHGVICGWDAECTEPQEWCTAMRISQEQRRKPFYHVLTDLRYAEAALKL